MKNPIVLLSIACLVGVALSYPIHAYLTRERESNSVSFLEVASQGPLVQPAVKQSVSAQTGFDFRSAAKKVNPSVVSIDRLQRVRNFFDRQVTERETGTGSGVILSSDGVIVTNNHVVAGNRGVRVRVRTFDGKTYDAKVLGLDPRSDLAVLKVEGKGLKPVELGSSSSLEVGEWVMAVGNPLGFDNTVSVGVVSSLKRNLPVGVNGLVEGIQTDASINPGNSGGALCNSSGQLVGINSAIASGTGESIGIGFAIPVDRMKKIVDDIVKYGEARYAGIGVSWYTELEGKLDNPWARAEIAEVLKREDFPNYGLLIESVAGPAVTVGIAKHDFLLEINNEKISTSFDLNKQLLTRKAGDAVTVKYWRNGEAKTAKVVLQELRTSI